MRKVVGAAAALLLLFGTAAGAVLPWKTFSGAAQDSTGADMGMCGPEQPAVRASLEKDGKRYVYFAAVAEEPYRVVFALMGEDGPVEVGVGTVDPAKHDDIPTLKWKKFEGEQPCDLLYPGKA